MDLAAEWRGWTVVAQSEIDPFCCEVLKFHWPHVPNLGDINTVDWAPWKHQVDLIMGGFPCQPVSGAGKRKGVHDERWLWPAFANAIRHVQPTWVVVENVPGLLTVNDGAAMAEVLADLADLGFHVVWGVLSAADVGAPHRRRRLWIVGHAQHARLQGLLGSGCVGDESGWEREEADGPVGAAGAPVVDADGGRREQRDASLGGLQEPLPGHPPVGDPGSAREPAWLPGSDSGEEGLAGEHLHPSTVLDWADAVTVEGADGTRRPIPAAAAEAGPESPLWPVADGVPGRVARLRAVGNAVVPACAYQVFRSIE